MTPNLRVGDSCRMLINVTLKFLATGDSFPSLQYLFRTLKNNISTIIPEGLDAIYNVLFIGFFKTMFSEKTLIYQWDFQMPNSKEEWK